MAMVADAGLTVTVSTGKFVTVMVALVLFPSLAAVTVVAPAVTPVTRPLLLTVATDVLPLDQTTTRPVSRPPAESLTTAKTCWVPPTRTLADAGLTVTEATGTVVTVIAAVPLLPSLVAVIVADPASTAVTRPVALTVATPGALLAQFTERPSSGVPLASCGMAASCTVAPRTMLATEGFSVTEATGSDNTVIVLVSANPGSGGSVAMTRYLPGIALGWYVA